MPTSRNQPCPCGSGKKYKRCCGAIKPSAVSDLNPSANVPVSPDLNQAQANSSRTYELYTGVKISAPDSLELITPYILQEQLDWFESEIGFVRELVIPGMNIIDIGANYGVYTFSMAQQTENLGKIWAFEPTSSAMKHLKYSQQLNLANNVELIPCALSDHCGEARLNLNANSEQNQLSENSNNADSDNSEVVALRTLDDFMSDITTNTIDFLKLDAEGKEENIIKGGMQFFKKFSPLVMYELVHAGKTNETLATAFEEINYKNYLLIPGLNILVPYTPEDHNKRFLLNLFACDENCANKLEARGLLIKDVTAECEMPDNVQDYLAAYYNNSPIAPTLANTWSQLSDSVIEPVNNILAFYIMAQDKKLPALTRFKSLQTACITAKECTANNPGYSDWSTYARVAAEFGNRAEAIEALQHASQRFNDTRTVNIAKPALPATNYYDKVNPGERYAEWLLSSIMEAAEKLRHWSSFFTGDSAMQNLLIMQEIGLASEEMHRRGHLIEQRYTARLNP